jgi:hypothetical protein
MAIRVETKATATLTADTGRVLAWTMDKEPGHISIAVPGDRAKMTPVQARELATWLLEESERVTKANREAAATRSPSVDARLRRAAGLANPEQALREALGQRVRAW